MQLDTKAMIEASRVAYAQHRWLKRQAMETAALAQRLEEEAQTNLKIYYGIRDLLSGLKRLDGVGGSYGQAEAAVNAVIAQEHERERLEELKRPRHHDEVDDDPRLERFRDADLEY